MSRFGSVWPRPLPRPWLAAALAVFAVLMLPTGALVRRILTEEVTPPPAPAQAAPAAVKPLPPCEYGDRLSPSRGYDDWRRTLLDTRLRLPKGYEPLDLVPMRRAGFPTHRRIRALVVADLAALREAATAAGRPIDVTWGYRSYRTQQWVFEYWSRRKGRDALLTSARPGHSEHQLGTAVDFRSEGTASVDRGWRYEPAGAWMRENAWRFGFVESYPLGKEDVTCYAHEPWHYRYVGRELARSVRDSGLTLREYLWSRAAWSGGGARGGVIP